MLQWREHWAAGRYESPGVPNCAAGDCAADSRALAWPLHGVAVPSWPQQAALPADAAGTQPAHALPAASAVAGLGQPGQQPAALTKPGAAAAPMPISAPPAAALGLQPLEVAPPAKTAAVSAPAAAVARREPSVGELQDRLARYLMKYMKGCFRFRAKLSAMNRAMRDAVKGVRTIAEVM